MIIGITGLMGSGKTLLCNEIIRMDNSFEYLDVDVFRHNLLSKKSYTEELSNALHSKINNYKDLNKIIYTNNSLMQKYKSVLYNHLFDYIKIQKKNLLVEWALIIQDDIQYIFDKLVITNRSVDDILLNEFTDLKKDEVKKRLEIQTSLLIGKEITIPHMVHENIKDTIQFIRG